MSESKGNFHKYSSTIHWRFVPFSVGLLSHELTLFLDRVNLNMANWTLEQSVLFYIMCCCYY